MRSNPTVAVTDYTFPALDVEQSLLAPLGVRLVAGQCRSSAEVAALISQADAVICQFAPVDAMAIAAAGRARVIVRYGIGVDNVDLEAARQRSIPVCNVRDYCIDEVADHALAMMLALTRHIVPNALAIRQGQWGLPVPLAAMRALNEMCVGIVGFGRIGRAVAARLRPFGCQCLAHDPLLPEDELAGAGVQPAPLDELLARTDLITLHCPSTAATRGMLGARAFARMKRGALLVNVARGDLVDTAELIAALQDGRLAGCALDVCHPEPIPAESPLRQMPQVIVSSHVASASSRAVRQLREAVARTVICALRDEPLPNVVNGVPARR